MTKNAILFSIIFLFVGLSSFNFHKFYVSIYQIDFVPEKKRVEITARIFMDDLNLALEEEYKTKTHIGEKSETSADVLALQKYMSKHFRVAIDGKDAKIVFHNKEIDNNVVVIYMKINEVKKFRSIQISNNALLDLYSDQQNIMQININNKKQNFIFTGNYFVENIRTK